MIDVDFTGVVKAGPLPEGQYLLVISDCQELPTESGYGQLDVSFEVERPAEFTGRTCRTWINLHPKSLPFHMDFFEALLGEELGAIQMEASQFVGSKVGAFLVHERSEKNPNRIYSNPQSFFPSESYEGEQF